MRHSLLVVPNVCTRPRAAADPIRSTFPRPELSVFLSQHGWRFKDRQVARDSIHRLRWQSRVVERFTKRPGAHAQIRVMIVPVFCNPLDIGELTGVPRLIGGVPRLDL